MTDNGAGPALQLLTLSRRTVGPTTPNKKASLGHEAFHASRGLVVYLGNLSLGSRVMLASS